MSQARTFILGTAGHVDHGKTTLVKALTGTDTDRLSEEHQRGISIELGFARLDLGDDLVLGIVDVPGHERFVRQMVSGAGGMDLAMLLVAADEGVMPQTREHLDVLKLLGVARGLVVLTRMDLADAELAEVVAEEVRELVTGTFLEGAPILKVSATAGTGLEELRAALRDLALACPARPGSGDFRLPIDRVFVLAGTGTVVTGTAWSGTVRPGDELRLLPVERRVRVRSVHNHDREVSEATAGSRVALALHPVKREEVDRGMQLVSGTAWSSSKRLGVEITAVEDPELAAWIKPRARFHVHHAAREVLGRLDLLGEEKQLSAGATTLARLVLEEELIARPGDRFVLRSYSPMHTVAGGRVLEPSLQAGERRERIRQRLEQRSHEPAEAWALPGPGDLAGRRFEECTGRLGMLGLDADAARRRIDDEESAGHLARVGELLFHRDALETLADRILRHLRKVQAARPLSTGLPKEELRGAVGFASGAGDFTRLLTTLARSQPIFVLGDRVRADRERPEVDEKTRAELVEFEERIRAATPLYEATDAELEGPLLRLLISEGRAAKLSGRLVAHQDLLEDLRQKVRAHFEAADELEISHMREWTQASRKFVVPLMEWLDAEDLTRFDGSVRRAGPAASRRD
jgi:selenocysteine-specific elongation factor